MNCLECPGFPVFAFLWSNGGITGDFTSLDGTDLGDGLYLAPFSDGFGYYLSAYLK